MLGMIRKPCWERGGGERRLSLFQMRLHRDADSIIGYRATMGASLESYKPLIH